MLKEFYNMHRGALEDPSTVPHWDKIEPALAEALETACTMAVQNAQAPLAQQVNAVSEGFNARQSFLKELFDALGLDADSPISVVDVIAAAHQKHGSSAALN